jgi:small GTP-binding protein
MISRKICMLGGYAVGKTSLVRKFVHGVFSEKYLTTIGVKIDKKELVVGGTELALILWDLAGEDGFEKVRLSYLRGASGYLLVVDGTREATLQTALSVQEKAQQSLGDVPFLLLTNKVDLSDEWAIAESQLDALRARGWRVLPTSAKDGRGVEDAFVQLANDILAMEAPS